MLFRQLFDQGSSTYTYLIADPMTRVAVLVDPVRECVDRDLQLIRELGLNLQHCLETHVHADHVTGTTALREATGCTGIVPAGAQVSCADRHIQDGERIGLGTLQLTALSTPGHTDSHMTYCLDDRVLTGDALFIRGCGRTDFQGGDPGQLYDSVHRLFMLPEATWVYPGHDYHGQMVSTIAEEKQWNPRFAGRDRNSFIELMNNLKLPHPRKMMEAIPANQDCGKVAI